MMENRPVVTWSEVWGWAYWRRDLTSEGHRGTSWGNGNSLYHDYGDESHECLCFSKLIELST